MLSSASGKLEAFYDVVVVGSGYGGAIAASRFARAGRSVCVLERGLEHHPGDFPETLWQGMRQFQITTRKRRFGKATKLFDLRLDDEANVLVGCGLGGTSLINANVALRPRPDVLSDHRWPAELRQTGALDPYFDRAEAWLGSERYPDDAPDLPKLQTLGDVAVALGGSLERAPINVNFSPARANAAGVSQPACNGCGNCVSGCNVGAKNTVLMNYLPDAVRHGATIFTGRSVRSVAAAEASEGQWDVAYELVGSGRKRFGASEQVVRADLVVLAAGTLGSTEILLRSRDAGLPVSDRLGERFTGNGDVLGFGYDSDRDVRGIGWTAKQLTTGSADPVGPTITGVVPVSRQDGDSLEGLVVEEGAIPGFLSRLMPLMLLWSALLGSDASVLARLRMILSSWRKAARRTLTYLVMSEDAANGRLALQEDHLVVDWPEAVSDERIAHSNELLNQVSSAIGAEFAPGPLSNEAAGREVLSVHPLGGCVMADDAEHGVTDHRGEVFSRHTGNATHRGLHVLDGSILSRPVDTNPSLTISAVTERAVEQIAAERGWSIDMKPNDEERSFDAEVRWAASERSSRRPGVRFTERMAGGDFSFRSEPSPLSVVLTIDVSDLALLDRDPGAAQDLSGTVDAPALSASPMMASNGTFHFLQRREDRAEEWNMVYRMDLHSAEGGAYRFEGRKVIRSGSLWRGWKNTTTLFATISELATPDHATIGSRSVNAAPAVLGEGTLRISVPDLLRQSLTMQAINADGLKSRWAAKLRFMRAFKGNLLPIHQGLLAGSDASDEGDHDRLLRPLRLAPASIAWYSPSSGWHDLTGDELDEARLLAAPDGILRGVGDDAQLMLTHHPSPAATKGPVLVAAGFSMRANSLAQPTTDTSLAEALAEAGFDVWLFDYRSCIALPSCRHDHTLDDIARVDWPEGIAEVRRRTGADTVQVVAHCVGSASLLMALLAGADGVGSAVCSQFSLHPHTSLLNRTKNALRIVDLVDAVGIEGLSPTKGRTLRSRLASRIVRLFPIPKGERCQQPVCRWLNGVFGMTHAHVHLNAATHESFTQAFGTGDVTTLAHLGRMTRAKQAIDADGNNTYLPHVDRLDLPLLFLQGTENYIFKPKGTDTTLAWLRDHHPRGDHQLLTLEGYAHLDGLVGSAAHIEVFPQIIDHLDRHA